MTERQACARATAHPRWRDTPPSGGRGSAGRPSRSSIPHRAPGAASRRAPRDGSPRASRGEGDAAFGRVEAAHAVEEAVTRGPSAAPHPLDAYVELRDIAGPLRPALGVTEHVRGIRIEN